MNEYARGKCPMIGSLYAGPRLQSLHRPMHRQRGHGGAATELHIDFHAHKCRQQQNSETKTRTNREIQNNDISGEENCKADHNRGGFIKNSRSHGYTWVTNLLRSTMDSMQGQLPVVTLSPLLKT